MADTKYYAVLTGDIINSRKLSGSQMADIQDALIETGAVLKKIPAAGCLYIDVFRGDSWQLLSDKPEKSLFLCLYIRAALKQRTGRKVNTRVSAAIDTIAFAGDGNTRTGNGRAFIQSGSGLDQMTNRTPEMIFYFADAQAGLENTGLDCLHPMIGLLDFVSQSWTPAQSTVAGKLMEGLSITEIAEFTGTNKSNIVQQQNRVGWKSIELAMSFFEHTINNAFVGKEELNR
jgi:hypothetical protein